MYSTLHIEKRHIRVFIVNTKTKNISQLKEHEKSTNTMLVFLVCKIEINAHIIEIAIWCTLITYTYLHSAIPKTKIILTNYSN